jgi:hypothetical protein
MNKREKKHYKKFKLGLLALPSKCEALSLNTSTAKKKKN